MDTKAPEPVSPISSVIENKTSLEISPKDIPEVNNDPEIGKADPIIDDYYLINPFFYEVANHFGVEQKDFDIAAPKLSAIVDWIIKEYGSKDTGDILLKISEIENKIQKPMWDEKRYTNMYRYIRLATQKQSIEKAMKAFERNNDNG